MGKGDQDLVQAVLDGRIEAYADLYDHHAPLIRAICHDWTQSLADAQDLAQEVFLRAYRKLHELRDPQRFGAWLVGIARRVCKEWRRSRARDRHRYVGLEPDRRCQPDCPPPGDESLLRLQDAIARLPEKERLAIHLAYLKEQPAEEARHVLGLSRSGFYRVLQRARKRLESALRERQESER
jgi:RNA polymerase sigma-70 factor (ECF subfamily)